MLKAVIRKIRQVDTKIASLSTTSKTPITPQVFFDQFAGDEDVEVFVSSEDFVEALKELVPSVPMEELVRYERLRDQFEVASSKDGKTATLAKKSKGKGKVAVK